MAETKDGSLDPKRWGLPQRLVGKLAEKLADFWGRFSCCFRTRTHDTSAHGRQYLEGLLRMDSDRNYANIARSAEPGADGQNLQHFMSDSPWSASGVFDGIQQSIKERSAWRGGMLTLDESGDEKAGGHSAGAGRQYLGRFGKVDVGQVGVLLGYAGENFWTMADAELFLLEPWFDRAHAPLRKRWHIPKERRFETKLEIGLRLIDRARVNGLSFRMVAMDAFYGRSGELRGALRDREIRYMAAIPANTQVYVSCPEIGVPSGCRTPRVVSASAAVEVRSLIASGELDWQTVSVRDCERGALICVCAARHVWTVTANQVHEDWLFVRREEDGTCSYALCNADADTPLAELASDRCQRYFVERVVQDAKSELGWDEFEARKYRAWMHHTALTALAMLFSAEVKADWQEEAPRDPALAEELEVKQLPNLSTANVRTLLQAVLPLPTLTPRQATEQVVRHLFQRARSTRSRLKKQRSRRQNARSP